MYIFRREKEDNWVEFMESQVLNSLEERLVEVLGAKPNGKRNFFLFPQKRNFCRNFSGIASIR